jgi:hypothetical protein
MDDTTMRIIDAKNREIRKLIKENLDLKNRLSLMRAVFESAIDPWCDLRLECAACTDGKRCGGGK